MSDNSMQSNIAAIFGSLWGKALGALAVMSMLLGIYMEIISVQRANIAISREQAQACSDRAKAMGQMANGSVVLGKDSPPPTAAEIQWQKDCAEFFPPTNSTASKQPSGKSKLDEASDQASCDISDDKCQEQHARKESERVRTSFAKEYGLLFAELGALDFCANRYKVAICQRLPPSTDVIIPAEYLATYKIVRETSNSRNIPVYDLMKKALERCGANYTSARCQLKFANGSQLTETRERIRKWKNWPSENELNQFVVAECSALYGQANCQ